MRRKRGGIVPTTPLVEFRVADVPTQDIVITIQGPDVGLLEPNAPADVEDPDLVMPDLIELFAHAARLGMWSGGASEPTESSAEVLASHHDPGQRKQTWHLRLNQVDRGGLRILYNLLTARTLDAISIRTESQTGPEPRRVRMLDRPLARFPDPFKPLPFQVDHAKPERSKDRVVHIIFSSPLDESQTDHAYAALETWTNLLLLGAYPPPELSPRESGAVPDLAFLLDPWTIEQSFTEVFLCDEAAFVPIINWAYRFHATGVPIDRITIV